MHSPARRTSRTSPKAARGRVGHAAGRSARAAASVHHSASAWSAPLVPRTPLPAVSAGNPQSAADTEGSSLPQAGAVEPVTVDEGEAHSVGQQLARGGTALSYPSALDRFFAALHQQEQSPGNDSVRVLQFGDSHTAADMFTGEARARMQARFGDGGVGFTYAGHPFAGYRILGSGRGESGSWQTLGTHFTQLGDAELGMGGVAIQTGRAGDTASLDAPCLTMEVQYLRQPGGGSFQLADNGMPVQTVSTSSGVPDPAVTGTANSTDAYPMSSPIDAVPSTSSLPASAPTGTLPTLPAAGQQTPPYNPYQQAPTRPTPVSTAVSPDSDAAGTLRHSCAPGSHHFTLTAEGGGPVRLLGTVALQPGITWESIGINGAEAPLLLRWNQGIFRTYLAAAAPRLIVLAYGTNEAAARWTGEEYRATFARLIDTLHRTAPGASILVVGPADRSLGSTTYTVVGRGRRARRIAHRYYVPFSGTARIVNAQREVCRTHGCAFWDWQARQGGFGAMNRWVAAGYAQPDHTHFTGTGYRALADALVADLLSAYSGYLAGGGSVAGQP